jgi:hypothetical protein
MALEKCPHCPQRVRKGTLELHLRSCIRYRRKQKNGQIDTSSTPVPEFAESTATTLPTETKKRGRPKGKKDETNN